jgi:uncharacterized protein (DUF2336 family)
VAALFPDSDLMTQAAQISELEELVGQLPADERTKALGHILDLFLQGSSQYGPGLVALFDTVILRFLPACDPPTLAALVTRLAAVANAPPRVIKFLASHEDIAIAEPVLMQSPSITEAALGEIARTKSQSHQLAIACRPQLSTGVTDPLLTSGDDVVVRYTFSNPGASFSQTGRKILMERSKNDGMLADLMKQNRSFSR